MLQMTGVVVQAEEQRADRALLTALVPAEAGHDAVALALVLDLEHDALVRLVGAVDRLGDDAVEPRALEALEPVASDADVARRRREVERRLEPTQRLFQERPAFVE